MRFLLFIVPIIFTIYTLVDCAGTDTSEIRNLPKWGWLLIIIFVGLIGSIGYWIAGRPRRLGNSGGGYRRTLPPDDNPDFLRNL